MCFYLFFDLCEEIMTLGITVNLGNLFIYQARESSLVLVGFLTAQFLQKV